MPSDRDTAIRPIPAAINVMDVARGVWRRKLMIAFIGFGSMAGAFGLLQVLKPVYSTEAKVLIQSLETPYDRVQAQDGQRSESAIDDRIITSQMAVVQSSDLGRRVVASLGLEQKPEFNALIKGLGTVSKIKIALGFGTDPRLKTPEQRALDRYLDQLSVYQPTNSNVIVIKYTSIDPKTAAEVANMLAETYVVWTREAQAAPTERAREWLAGQIAGLRQKLAKSEEAVENFRAQAGLLQGETATLGAQEISELNTQMTVARTQSGEARAKADAIRELLESKGNVETSADVLASAAVQRLKEQRTEATRRVAELSAVYLGNHPRMIAANSEVAAIDKQMRNEALKVVASLEEQARVASAREKSLRASLDQLKSQETAANLDDVKLKALEREVAADRALLETMLSRYAEASSREDETAQPGIARIIESAGVPVGPSFPKAGPLVIMITIAGFVVAFGIAFLAELMAAAARLTARMSETASDEIERWRPAPPPPMQAAPAQQVPPPPGWQTPPIPRVPQYLASMPQAPGVADAVAAAAAPAMTAIGAQLAGWAQNAVTGGTGKRIGVTALGGGNGDTSMAALALARTMANAGRRVVLIDLSRGGSWLESLCGVAKGPGISDLVTGAADFTKVIGRDAKSPLHLVRHGNDRGPGAASLIVERAGSVLMALAQAYEMAVVNLGAVQQETPALLHKCDGVLVLAPPSRQAEAMSAAQALTASGVKAVGHVLLEETAAEPGLNFKLA